MPKPPASFPRISTNRLHRLAQFAAKRPVQQRLEQMLGLAHMLQLPFELFISGHDTSAKLLHFPAEIIVGPLLGNLAIGNTEDHNT